MILMSLDKLRDSITDEYARGKISKEQFDKLVERHFNTLPRDF